MVFISSCGMLKRGVLSVLGRYHEGTLLEVMLQALSCYPKGYCYIQVKPVCILLLSDFAVPPEIWNDYATKR